MAVLTDIQSAARGDMEEVAGRTLKPRQGYSRLEGGTKLTILKNTAYV